MNKKEILSLSRGSDTCFMVALHIMGWELYRNESFLLNGVDCDYWVDPETKNARMVSMWTPDSDIEDAFEVIERMHELGYKYTLRGFFMGEDKHIAAFDNQNWADNNPLYQASADAAPLAICRAALLAVKK